MNRLVPSLSGPVLTKTRLGFPLANIDQDIRIMRHCQSAAAVGEKILCGPNSNGVRFGDFRRLWKKPLCTQKLFQCRYTHESFPFFFRVKLSARFNNLRMVTPEQTVSSTLRGPPFVLALPCVVTGVCCHNLKALDFTVAVHVSVQKMCLRLKTKAQMCITQTLRQCRASDLKLCTTSSTVEPLLYGIYLVCPVREERLAERLRMQNKVVKHGAKTVKQDCTGSPRRALSRTAAYYPY